MPKSKVDARNSLESKPPNIFMNEYVPHDREKLRVSVVKNESADGKSLLNIIDPNRTMWEEVDLLGYVEPKPLTIVFGRFSLVLH